MVQSEIITDMSKFINEGEQTNLFKMLHSEEIERFVWGLGYMRINTQEAFFVSKGNDRAMMICESEDSKTIRIILSGAIPVYKDLLNCIECNLSYLYDKVIINCVDSSLCYRELFKLSSEYMCSSYENKNELILDCKIQRLLNTIETKTIAPLTDRAYFSKGEFKTLLFATEGIVVALDINNKVVMHSDVEDEDGYVANLKETAMREVTFI
ncbi:hypothetical protein [Clostridium perfringens]|uniref:hypothetical protein n=1 Tax=Clostridium perfringens TaxID=1502 RepID=UPI0024BC9A45|nr:hypothetical protein [Clostridium perfringens]